MTHPSGQESPPRALVDLLKRSASRRQVLKTTLGLAVTSFLAACGVGGATSTAGASSSSGPTGSSGGSTSAPTGTTAAASPSYAPKKVALILPTYTQARWQAADQPYFIQEATKLNLNVIVQVSNNDPALQASQVENVLTQGIDVLVLGSVDADSAVAMVQKAQAANVPVIAYNYIISKVPLAAIVARDAEQVGIDIGNAAVKAVPKGNYINALGDQGNSVGQQKGAGNLQAINPSVASGAIKVVSQQWNANFDPTLVQKQVENALTANKNDIQAILATADVMAYGAIQALTAQGLAGKVWVGGEDCEIQALKDIVAGTLSVSSFTPFDQMGIAAAQAARQAADGQPVTSGGKTLNNGSGDIPWVLINAFNVDKTNISKFAADYGWWLSANKSSAADLGL